MNNREIKPCALYGGGIAGGGAGPLVGAKLTMQRLIISQSRLNQHLGLEQHFAQAGPSGARAIADVMGPGSVIDEPPELREEILVCERCLLPVLAIFEQANERRAEEVEVAEVATS